MKKIFFLILFLLLCQSSWIFAQKVEKQIIDIDKQFISESGMIKATGNGNVDKVFMQNETIKDLIIPPGLENSKAPDIDTKTAGLIALKRAINEWGGQPSIGSIIPIKNPIGEIIAYDIDLSIDGSSWESYSEIANNWRAILKDQNDNYIPYAKKQNSDTYKINDRINHTYGRITISATYERSPIISTQRGVSNFYASGWICKIIAQKVLNDPDPDLLEIYLAGPWERSYRFSSGNKSIIVQGHEPWNYYDYEYFINYYNSWFTKRQNSVFKLFSENNKKPEQVINDTKEENQNALSKILNSESFPIDATNYIPGYSSDFERFEWHYGCSPSAGAMVLNYWENVSWYGKLNYWYFREYDDIEGDTDCHIPRLQYQLKNFMGTDASGGTSPGDIHDGMKDYANAQGYSFTDGYDWTGLILGWQWDEITDAINNDVPFVWSLDWFPSAGGRHSVAAVGYDDVANEVKCYSTWWTNGNSIQSVSYSGGVIDFSFGASPYRGGAIYYDAKLTSLDGGTTFSSCNYSGTLTGMQTVSITWDNFGNPGHHVNLYYSTNSGIDWNGIAGNEPDDESFTWTVPNINTSQARILIQQYSTTSTIVSSDGSYGDFRIEQLVPNLTVSTSSVPINSASGSNGTFNITSNTTWSISDNQTWLTVSPTSGSNNGTITVTATSANPSTSSRSATVTITGTGVSTQYVTVTQAGATPTLSVSTTSVNVGSSSGSNGTFNITSNTTWSISDNQTWLTVSPTSGSNNGTITVTATSANPSTSSRSATVTITGTGVSTQYVTVTQAGATPTLSVSTTSVNVGSSSGSNGTFNITSNTTWSISDNQTWLTVSPTSGSNNGTITVTATSANPSTSSRSATVTITGTGVSTQYVTVTQAGATPTLSVSTTSVNVGSSSGSNGTFNITSNTTWSISDNQTWLTVSPTSGSNNGTITVTATSANPSTSSRSATVTITGTGVSTQYVTVTQAGATPTLSVSTTSVNVGSSSGSNGTFNITSNTTWSISDNQTWLTVSPTSGSNNGTITVTATSANPSTSSRSATVTITGTGVSTQYVTVTQAGATPTLSVSTTSVNVGSSSGSNGTFNITSNTTWSISDNQTWLTVSPTSGSNNGTITVTATSANPSTSSRSATVTITGTGVSTQYVTVTQDGTTPTPYLTLSPSSLTISSSSGSSGTFNISSNTSWSITDDASWLTVSPTSGSNGATLTVQSTSSNTSASPRTATVTITGTGVSTQYVTVTQDGTTPTPYLTLSPSSLTISSSSGSSGTFNISSNTSWSITDDASWLTVSPTSGSNGATLTVQSTSSNTSASPRTATVTITGTGVSTQYVTVTQDGTTIIISTFPYNQNFDSFPDGTTAGTIAEGWINVNTGDDNIDWTVQTGPTTSIDTGPSSDHTSGTGKYLYTEASGSTGNPNKTAFLLTPQIDLSSLTNPELRFFYHMYGATMGSLSVDVVSGTTWTHDLFSMSGDLGDNWLEAVVDLSSFSGIIQIRFRGITGTGYYSDMAIDDVTIANASIGALSVSIPHTGSYDISPEGDVDWYRVDLTSGTPYRFVNNSPENYDTEFYLYGPGNSDGSDIGPMVTVNDDGGISLQPYIRYTPSSSGYYYLRVAYFSNNPAGVSNKDSKSPDGKILATTGNYTLSIAVDIDGNSVPTFASTITSPHTGNYEINPVSDIDWYRISLNEEKIYTFENSTSSDLDSKFWLYGPGSSDGNSLDTLVASDDDSGGNLQPLMEYSPATTGYYYLRVAYYSNYPITGTGSKNSKIPGNQILAITGDYTLTISETTAKPAPTNFVAGNNFDGIVPLTWDRILSTPTDTINYYNVYRAGSSGGPYTLIGNTSASVQVWNYIDNTVTNGNTYFYIVTALYTDGDESGYSAEVIAAPITNGMHITSPHSLAAPTNDGTINSSEWNDAYSMDIRHPGVVQAITLYMKNDDGNLYLALDDPNNTSALDANDILIFFDDDNNDTWDAAAPSTEGYFILGVSNNAVYKRVFRPIHGDYPLYTLESEITNPTGFTSNYSISSGHMQYELSIDLSASVLTAIPGNEIGIRIASWNQDLGSSAYYTFDTGTWPYGSVNRNPLSYGKVTLGIQEQISLAYPANNSLYMDTDFTLYWHEDNSAISYNLQVASDGSFNNLIINETAVTDTFYQLSGLNNLSNYFWRVKGNYPTEEAIWSEVWQFQTGEEYGWAKKTSGVENYFNNIQTFGTTGWVGSSNILRSTSSGTFWGSKRASGSGSSYFLNSDLGWAGVFYDEFMDPFITKTTDGGNTWSDYRFTAGMNFHSYSHMHFFNTNSGIAIGDEGRIHTTTDGGLNWNYTSRIIYDTFEYGAIAMFYLDGSTWWAATDFGGILNTTNGGGTWESQPASGAFYDLYFTDVNNGWAVGPSGIILHTTNSGTNWQTQTSGTTNDLRAAYFVDNLNGWAAGDAGTIIKTTDGGLNWTLESLITSDNLTDLYFVDVNEGWAVGGNGTILKYNSQVVSNPPQISVTPANISFSVPIDGSDSQILNIANISSPGSDNLVWNITEQEIILISDAGKKIPIKIHKKTNLLEMSSSGSTSNQQSNGNQVSSIEADCLWLTEDQVSGTIPAGGNQDVDITVDATGLSSGTYSCNLNINNNDPNDPIITRLVNLTVTNGPTHFTFLPFTGNDAQIVIPTDSNPNIDGVPLSNGDEIGAFTPGGLCVGAVVWASDNALLTVWGDNDQTPEIDGIQAGEEIGYKVWDQSESTEYENVTVAYSLGNGVYSADAFFTISSLNVNTSVTQTIALNVGWNMISSYVIPEDLAIENICSSISNEIKIMKNGYGEAYIPQYGINTIGNWNISHGYKINMLSAQSLAITGMQIDPASTTISLVAGWNMISYFKDTPMDAAQALNSIASVLVIAKNIYGQAYIPQYGINTIGDMIPGQGYKINVTSAATLTYPPNSIMAKSDPFENLPIPKHYSPFTKVTGSNCIILVNSNDFEELDEVGAYDRMGMMIGSGVIKDRRAMITVWGDDETTEGIKEGPIEGERLELRVWKNSEGNEIKVSIERIEDGLGGMLNDKEILYNKDGLMIADISEKVIPHEYQLSQNYPNPFNPSTTIKYNLPQETHVRIDIINTLGESVKVLVNQVQQSGEYEISFSSENIVSGVYLLRLHTDNFTDVKKMILLK